MKKNKLTNIILALGIYLPFEDFILKWLPVPENVFVVLRQLPDIIILSFLCLMLLTALLVRRIDIASNKVFIVLMLFIASTFVSVLLNGSSIISALPTVKALVRYMFLMFILYWIKPTEKQALLFIKSILVVVFIEATIGIAQYFIGGSIRDIFKPRELETIEYAVTALRKGSTESFGTMAYTINYGFFLVIGLVFSLCFGKYFSKHRVLFSIGILYLFVAIYCSGSRSAFLSALISIGLFMYYRYGIRLLFYVVPLSLSLFMAIIFLDTGGSARNFWYFLSPGYINSMESQRLGMIKIFIDYLANIDNHLLFGLSSDKQYFVNYISANYRMPIFFKRSTLTIFEDLYWVALTFYYGIIGLLLFSMVIINIFKEVSIFKETGSANPLQSDLIVTCKIMLLLLIPVNFVNQMFAVRQFSFYVWAVIGFTLSLLHSSRNNENITNK